MVQYFVIVTEWVALPSHALKVVVRIPSLCISLWNLHVIPVVRKVSSSHSIHKHSVRQIGISDLPFVCNFVYAL